jgi:hypothetical protein
VGGNGRCSCWLRVGTPFACCLAPLLPHSCCSCNHNQTPHNRHPCRQLIDEHGPELTVSSVLDAMPYCEAVVKEVLRVTPPSAQVMRRTVVDMEVRMRGRVVVCLWCLCVAVVCFAGCRRPRPVLMSTPCNCMLRALWHHHHHTTARQICGKFVKAGTILQLSSFMGQVCHTLLLHWFSFTHLQLPAWHSSLSVLACMRDLAHRSPPRLAPGLTHAHTHARTHCTALEPVCRC